jgi:hypothetical protein
MQIYGERKHTSRGETLKGQAAEIVSKKVPNSDVGFKEQHSKIFKLRKKWVPNSCRGIQIKFPIFKWPVSPVAVADTRN